MRKLSFFVILLLAFAGCTKDEGVVTKDNFTVILVQGIYDVSLIWTSVKGYPSEKVTFSIFLGDSLIADSLPSRSFVISNLREKTSYDGRIEAFYNNRLIGTHLFSFITLEDQPPSQFNIREIAVSRTTVDFKWEESLDPENKAVVYDIYIDEKLKFSGLNGLSFSLSGLMPSVNYKVGIAARDSTGNTAKLNFEFRTIQSANSLLVHRFFKYQGYNREMAWYMPVSADTSDKMPLVFYLHGANGNAWHEIRSTGLRAIADREKFILLMPQALLGAYNGESLFQWNAHYIFPWDDVSLMNYIIDYMYSRYRVDLSKVFVCGMSNGGFMTFFASRGLQERIAAIAPISGLISTNVFNSFSLNRSMPLCYMHGTADEIVPIDGSPSATDVIDFWKENNNCTTNPQITQLPDLVPGDNSTVTLFQYNGYFPSSEIQFYRINGGNHSVPGNEPGANMDIDAYEVIWSFFKRHSYPDHQTGTIVDTK